jgi:hypothetical protein
MPQWYVVEKITYPNGVVRYRPYAGPFAVRLGARVAMGRYKGRWPVCIVSRSFLARHGFPRTPRGEAELVWAVADHARW